MSESATNTALSELTLSSEGSPVKISATAASGPVLTEQIVGYGKNTDASFGYFDHNSRSLKMSQLSLGSDWIESSAILPKSGSMRSGKLFQRPILGPPSGAKGYGFWPTPDTKGFTNEGSIAMLCRMVDSYRELLAMSYRGGKKYRMKYWPNVADHELEGTRIGYLNPAWLEWLMGFPSGWTVLGD